MAIKYVCDRCNEEIRNNDTTYYHLTVFKSRYIKETKPSTARTASKREMDLELCEACYNELDTFIRTSSKRSQSYSIPSEKTTTLLV